MSENGDSPPPETLLCGRCDTVCELEDNFCRHCGLPLHDPQLPSVRDEQNVPALWQPPLPAAVIKGAAFVAAGTLAEVLVRRLVRSALRRGPAAPQAPARRAKGEVVPQEDGLSAETHMESETLLLRRIRFRR